MWEKISINKFKDIIEVQNNNSDILYDNEIKLLSIVFDKSEDYYENLSFEDFSKELLKLKFLKEEIKVNENVSGYFKVKDRIFKLKFSNKDITANDYINLNSLNQKTGDFHKNLQLIVSLFLVEYKSILGIKFKKRKQQNLEDLSDFINTNMSIVDATSIASFFLTLSEQLIKIMKFSLILKMKKMWKKEKNQDLKDKILASIQIITTE